MDARDHGLQRQVEATGELGEGGGLPNARLAVINLPALDPARLPVEVAIPAIVLAELAQGVAMTKSPAQVMIRSQRLADIEAAFAAIPLRP